MKLTQTLTALVTIISFLAASSAIAKTQDDAIANIANHFANNASKIQKKEIAIEVVNYHSNVADSLAKQIQSKIYLALQEKLPNLTLVQIEESLGGFSLTRGIIIKGTYQKNRGQVTLTFTALSKMDGNVFASKTEKYQEASQGTSLALVAVLDIETPFDTSTQKALSSFFRSALDDSNSFNLASSADVNRMNADKIQKSYGCSREECAIIIGEQLGVDRVISSSIIKFGTSYALTATLMDIQSGENLKSVTIKFKGKKEDFDGAVKTLAKRLSRFSRQVQAQPTMIFQTGGVINVTSTPIDAEIYLDGQKTPYRTPARITNIPSGLHTVLVKNKTMEQKQEFSIFPGQTKNFKLEFEISTVPIPKDTFGSYVTIPAGNFLFGKSQNYNQGLLKGITLKNMAKVFFSEVYLSEFQVQQTEVTTEQYNKCKEAGKCASQSCTTGNQNPVVCVTWSDAQGYCNWVGGRLLTEAEWDRVASWKNGIKYKYATGKPKLSCEDAVFRNATKNCSDKKSWSVASKSQEINGTYDMEGNVSEWVQDWYSVFTPKLKGRNPQGPAKGPGRLIKGKNFKDYRDRRVDRWNDNFVYVGFRCAHSAP